MSTFRIHGGARPELDRFTLTREFARTQECAAALRQAGISCVSTAIGK
jgi:hypothetical protein